ncbi:hypothetical protein Hdeb2414_s0211g00834401 [Helianthus debilis subsp. tardiflorus]
MHRHDYLVRRNPPSPAPLSSFKTLMIRRFIYASISTVVSVVFCAFIPPVSLLAEATLIAQVVNYWWPGLPSNLSQQAFSKQFLQDQWSLRVAHHSPSLTYRWKTRKWFPSLTVIAHSPDILSRQDILKPIFAAGRVGVKVLKMHFLMYHCVYRFAKMAGFGSGSKRVTRGVRNSIRNIRNSSQFDSIIKNSNSIQFEFESSKSNTN